MIDLVRIKVTEDPDVNQLLEEEAPSFWELLRIVFSLVVSITVVLTLWAWLMILPVVGLLYLVGYLT